MKPKRLTSVLTPKIPVTIYDKNWSRFDGVFVEETTDNRLCLQSVLTDDTIYLPLADIATITFYLH